MDLTTRKYNFIQELINVDEESVIEALEHVLKREKGGCQEVPAAHKQELDKRLENYQNNPDDLLDWESVKKDW